MKYGLYMLARASDPWWDFIVEMDEPETQIESKVSALYRLMKNKGYSCNSIMAVRGCTAERMRRDEVRKHVGSPSLAA